LCGALNNLFIIVFLSQVIDHVCRHLKIPQPVTTAANIVTGSDPELTNTLLQQLAVSLYTFQNKDKVNTSAVVATPEVSESVTTTSVVPSWITSLRVMTSLDGINYTHSQTYNTGLSDENTTAVVHLLPQNVVNNAVHAKYIKLVPVEWSGGNEVGSALRCDVMVIDKKAALQASTGSI
jgi:hypothetical protein